MTISYENTDQDAIAWNIYRVLGIPQNRQTMNRWRVRITLFCCALFFLLFHLASMFGDNWIWQLFWAVACASGAGVGNALAMKRNLSRQTRTLSKQGLFHSFIGPRTVTFDADGIRSRHAGGESLYLWHTVRQVNTTPTHFALSLSAQEFAFIPRRAFNGEAQEQEFLALVERYRTGVALGINTTSVKSVAAPATVAPSTTTPWYQSRYSVDVDTPEKQQTQRVNRVG